MRELLAALAIGTPFAVGASVAAEDDGDVVWRFQDPEIVESSGLVVDDDLVVTVNDSGSGATIYAVDLRDGRTVGTTTWQAEPEDTEALAPAGERRVWVADIGDNLRVRSSVTVTRVPYGPGDLTVPGESYELVYPDGPADAEALLAHPETGRLYVVTKGFAVGTVYAAPRRLDPEGENRLREVGTAPGMVTDGTFLPDGRHVVLRGYGSATVHAWPSLEEVATFRLPRQQQGEGIAVAPDGGLYLSSEGPRSPLRRVELPSYGTPPPAEDDAGGPTTPGAPTTGPEPGPATDGSDPELWPWVAGWLVGLAALVVLLRSLRPR